MPESQPNDQLSVTSPWFLWLEKLEGVAARHELRDVEAGDPKRCRRACGLTCVNILDCRNQENLAVIPWRKPFRVLNVPFAAIANLHSRSITARVLNEQKLRRVEH